MINLLSTFVQYRRCRFMNHLPHFQQTNVDYSCISVKERIEVLKMGRSGCEILFIPQFHIFWNGSHSLLKFRDLLVNFVEYFFFIFDFSIRIHLIRMCILNSSFLFSLGRSPLCFLYSFGYRLAYFRWIDTPLQTAAIFHSFIFRSFSLLYLQTIV